jgi:hypothetical protein
MNVTFHALASFATAAVLSAKLLPCQNCFFLRSDLPFLAIGFVTGVLMHGILDFAPHSYPIWSKVDVPFCLAMFFLFAWLVKRRNLILLSACYVGCLFPDLLDLSSSIINKYVGTNLPVYKFFPWHWHIYSGSIYDGSRRFESNLWHLLLFVTSVTLLVVFRRRLFRFYEDVGK